MLQRKTGSHPVRVVTPNIFHLHLASIDPEVTHAVNSAEIVIPDGWPVSLALRIFEGDRRGRMTGSDLALDVMKAAEQAGRSVGIIGGSAASNAAAVENVRTAYPSLRLVEFSSNPFLPLVPTEESVDEFVRVVHEDPPDILLLCVGAPKSELHLDLAHDRLDCASVLCVGATVDFLAGTKARAPRIVQSVGLEWAFRLIQEPRRLGRRYLVSAVSFSRVFVAEHRRRRRMR